MNMKSLLTTLVLSLAMCTSMMAQTANVTTDKRFVRGATMAFGRMTVSGISNSQIKEQGFCYAIDNINLFYSLHQTFDNVYIHLYFFH